MVNTNKEKTMAETAIPKAEWGPGPWQDEPDTKDWTHLGYRCLIIRNTLVSGSLCGYVGVPPGHPWHGYNGDNIETHCGITFNGRFANPAAEVGMSEEDAAGLWFLGFDCAHHGDLSPGLEASLNRAIPGRQSRPHGVYRDMEYVTRCVEDLAMQASDAAD